MHFIFNACPFRILQISTGGTPGLSRTRSQCLLPKIKEDDLTFPDRMPEVSRPFRQFITAFCRVNIGGCGYYVEVIACYIHGDGLIAGHVQDQCD